MSFDGTHNVKITQVTLGLEDHGIPTSYLRVEGERSMGFGGFDLRPDSAMCNWVQGIQRVLGVDDWSKVKGQFCRVLIDDNSVVVAIGHIVDDRWFRPESDLYK